MMSRIPVFLNQSRICVICEGSEEYDYLLKLKSLNVWADKYEIFLENADGNGNIPARYQDKFQNGSYDIVLVFCDTDKKPYEQYEDIKRKINEFHGVEDVANNVIIYGNPCTMQIILRHWEDVKLKTSAKSTNAPLIEDITGIINYKGRADQRKQLMDQITEDNYHKMCRSVKELINDDAIVGSSNFSDFIERLMNADDSWIKQINRQLDAD